MKRIGIRAMFITVVCLIGVLGFHLGEEEGSISLAAKKWDEQFTVEKNDGDIIYYGLLSEDKKSCWIQNIQLKESQSQKKLTVPKTLKGAKVTQFGADESQANNIFGCSIISNDSAYKPYSKLTAITLPGSITTLTKYCFYGLNGLKTCKLPSKLTQIEEKTFYRCTELTKVNVPASVKHMESGCFGKCDNLKSIQIHKKNKNFAFRQGAVYSKNKKKLIMAAAGQSKISLIRECSSIEPYAFSGGITKEVVLTKHTKTICEYAFSESSVAIVNISSGVKKIGNNAFAANMVKSITVAKRNKVFVQKKNSIYEKKSGTLIIQTIYSGTSTTIEPGVKVVDKSTMFVGTGVKTLYSVTFPNTLKKLKDKWATNAGGCVANLTFDSKNPTVIMQGALTSMSAYPNMKVYVPSKCKLYYLIYLKGMDASKVEVLEI